MKATQHQVALGLRAKALPERKYFSVARLFLCLHAQGEGLPESNGEAVSFSSSPQRGGGWEGGSLTTEGSKRKIETAEAAGGGARMRPRSGRPPATRCRPKGGDLDFYYNIKIMLLVLLTEK